MAIKHLFKMMVRFNRELYIEYAYAYTQKQAKIVVARRIARKQEVLPWVVMSWLKEHPENYDVQIETEFKELD